MDWKVRLREIMKEKGVNQKDLAQMLDVAPPTISNMLTRDVRISSLERIAFVLKVPLQDFFKEETKEEVKEIYDEAYRETHVHGYIRIGKRIVEVNSMDELKAAVTACEVNYLK